MNLSFKTFTLFCTLGFLCGIIDVWNFKNFHSYLFLEAYLAKELQIYILCPMN